MPAPQSSSSSFSQKLRNLANSIGPGIFILGYIVGTGSVTSMASSGAKYGLSLTWALALSCIFTYFMTVAISRVTIVSGQTLLHSIQQRFGWWAAILIIIGLMLTVLTSVMGLLGIISDIVREWTRPLTPSGNGIHPVISTAFFIALLYYLFWGGTQHYFLRGMAVLVGIMSACFVLTMIMVIPEPATVIRGLIPGIPTGHNAHLILAGMVGTTMATVCLVTRSYLVAEKGWTLADLDAENRDSAIALFLTFIVSGSIMAAAAGTMHVKGIEVTNAIDMVNTLEPLAGRFATSVFVFGIIAAGLSSTFPNMLLGPWAVFDVTNKPRQMTRPWVRITVAAVALLGFVVPVFGGRPVILMIASQAVSPIVMPLLILLVTLLLTDKRHADRYKNPAWLTIALYVTLAFSLFVSYAAIVGLTKFVGSALG